MATKFQVPRGTRDILPGESERWIALEATTREIMSRYGYREVRTPLFESTTIPQSRSSNPAATRGRSARITEVE